MNFSLWLIERDGTSVVVGYFDTLEEAIKSGESYDGYDFDVYDIR